jgi:CheY-like chemotaxis protein
VYPATLVSLERVNRTGREMTESSDHIRILMVDDEPNVLDGYRRALHGRLRVVTAGSGVAGLAEVQQAIDEGLPFPVVVSDMMMPSMNGVEFLERARALDPDAVQLLLSGQADLESTIAAVNGGNLFRFLTKPCATPELEQALTAAIEQHRLVFAERDLLERTLGGAVDVLTELLSMSSPDAFTRTERVRTLIELVAATLDVEDWRLPLAAMLSQIGCIAVPPEVLQRAHTGGELTAEERDVYLSHPQTAQRLLERIPRLEDVAVWVGNQPVEGLHPAGKPVSHRANEPARNDPDLPRLIFRASLSYLATLDANGLSGVAMRLLEVSGEHSQMILGALKMAATALAPQGILHELTVHQVRPGMLLDADVETITGMTLVRKGERVTEAVAMRLTNFAKTVGVREPIMVLVGV